MRLLPVIILAALPVTAFAQDQAEEDKGFLTRLIEDNLSGDNQYVDIQGFAGALSSEASMTSLTIADDDGVWLTLQGVVMEWNRSALLRGAIDIQTLAAERIIVSRTPNTNTPPEAAPFALPELPVSIQLDELAIQSFELNEVFLGEPVALSLTGSASLAGGEGIANVLAERIDSKTGSFKVEGEYANDTQLLALLLDLNEGPDGIAARLLDLPGRPSVELRVEGVDPISDYNATLSLATDGTQRLNGTFDLDSRNGQTQIELDVGGDISPLLAPEYSDFFGTEVALRVVGTQPVDGGFDLSTLDLRAQKLRLQGQANIGPGGWPERLAITGAVQDADGDIVLLPIGGPKTYVDRINLNIGYDRSVSNDWTAEFDIAGFDRPGLLIRQINLSGDGIIIEDSREQEGRVTADMTYAAQGVELDDAGAAEAFGDTVSGEIVVDYVAGTPVTVERLTLTGPGIEMLGEATIDTPEENFRTKSTVALGVDALARFATLAGQPDLAGSADLTLISTLSPLEGLYDVLLTGDTNDLAIGIAQLDPLLRGAGSVSAQAVRDTTGTYLSGLRIATDEATVTADAAITSENSLAEFAVGLRELSVILPDLSGPAQVGGTASRNPAGTITFDIDASGPSVTATADGTVVPSDVGQTVNASIVADVSNLSTYAALAGQPLAGAANLNLDAVVLSDGLRFDADLSADTVNLQTGIAQADALLEGRGRLSAEISRTGTDSYRIANLTVATPAIDLSGNADGSLSGAITANIDATLNDAGQLAAGLTGPVTIDMTADRNAALVTDIDMRMSGSGTDVTLDAQVASADDGNQVTADLDARIADLSAFRPLIGQPVSGGVTVDLSGSILPDLSTFDLRTAITTANLAIGNAQVDQLLRGTGQIDAAASRTDGTIRVPALSVSFPQVSANGTLTAQAEGTGSAQFQARLADVGLFTDALSGPVTAQGTATRNSASWTIDVDGAGPGGITLSADGTVADSGNLNINATGQASLGLANSFIAPRRLSGDATFNLSVNGPPALSSVSGQIATADARLAAPTVGQALENINGAISLSGSGATVNLSGNVANGGTLSVNGPVALSAPFNGDLTLRADSVIIRDRTLFETSVNGLVSVNGPLTGGAAIAGTLAMGETNVRVPSSGIGALGDLPDVTHIGASRAVRQTLDRAGANNGAGGGSDSSSASGPAFPLDLTITAPNRIFVRGRGLDAELGGSLKIGGTSNNVIPTGEFDLIRGRLTILRQRFDLTEGAALLEGDFIPVLRLVAETRARTGTLIRIIVEGPANAPEVTFQSTPELPQDEVLAQLIFGRNLTEISPLQAVQLAAAVGTLAGRGGGGIIDNFRQSVGLDDFDVTTDDDGNAEVRAGKYLSENLYTEVTVTAEGETEINLNLDITSDITAKGTVNADGDTSVGVFFERDY